MKVLAHLAVTDYEGWKKAYDGEESVRREFGCIGTQVFRDAEGQNEVLLLQEWESPESHKRFIAESNLPEAMKRGGSSLMASYPLG